MKLRVSSKALPVSSRSVLLSLMVWSVAALAQERGFDVHRTEGSAAGGWLFMLDRPWYSLTRTAAIGVRGDYAWRSLVPAVATGRGEISPVLEHAVVGQLDLAVSLFDRVRLSGSLPVSLFERGTPELVSGAAPASMVGVGDPRVGVVFRLFGQAERDVISGHVGAEVWIPIGAQAALRGDTGVRVLPRVVLAGAAGAARWTLELSYLHRPYASLGPPALGLVAAPEARAGLGLGVSLLNDALHVGPEARFSTQVLGAQAFTPAGMSLEVLLGVNALLAETVMLGVAGGAGFLGIAGTADARGIVRLAWAPRAGSEAPVLVEDPAAFDADLDGVKDELDRCPFEPELRNGLRDEDGCPEAVLADEPSLARLLAGPRADAGVAAVSRPGGLAEAVDAGAPAVVASVDAGGAPSVAEVVAFGSTDSDGDGVSDEDDRCPVVKEDSDGFEDDDGCPEGDNDQDGFADATDRCPLEAEARNGIDDDDGCPDAAPDADQDGVADAVDRCPFEPETVNGLRDLDGCPEAATAEQVALAPILAPPEPGLAPAITWAAPAATPTTPATKKGRDSVPPPPQLAPAQVFGQGDADRDGVLDEADRCPVSAEDADGFEDEDGCPELDNDDDTVVDAKDRCAGEAETVNGWQDDDGCPDEHPDVDGDNVLYADDRCPFEAGGASDGCPHLPAPPLALPGFALPLPLASAGVAAPASVVAAVAAPDPARADYDQDGTLDEADACPVTREDGDGFEDEDGCPELDNDADGVDDTKDKCPYEAETINGVKDADGCPDVGAAVVHVEKDRVVIDDVIQFKPASATLQTSANGLLLQVALNLKARRALSVEIQGHTDDTGSALQNIKLSQKRAEAIKAVLVKAGVAPSRLVARGYGPTRPRASNKTAEGREKNRRVEFLILGEAP